MPAAIITLVVGLLTKGIHFISSPSTFSITQNLIWVILMTDLRDLCTLELLEFTYFMQQEEPPKVITSVIYFACNAMD
jgi:hypothetical protein